jgi:protein Tex
MISNETINFIKQQSPYPTKAIESVLQMHEEGATIPFMARYRKERTGSLDEVDLGDIVKLSQLFDQLTKRKVSILESISEQGKLTDELKSKIEDCTDLTTLEDLYLPYKKRRKTKADIAKEHGLEPLAKMIMVQNLSNPDAEAKKYINENVPTSAECLQGAQYIIAEWISENVSTRDFVRAQMRKTGMISSKVIGTKKEDATTYKDYFEFEESVQRIPSHRLLAILRGQMEGLLRVALKTDDEYIIEKISSRLIKREGPCADLIQEAAEDGYKRLLQPSVENQIINEAKAIADKEAILVFTKNLRQLLLAAPLGAKPILAIDPGFRTGCKVACLSANGDLLSHTTIYPTPPQNDTYGAESKVMDLITKHAIQCIAIGNGTASRETESFIKKLIKQYHLEIQCYVVSESGASIYSASEVGREEFPDIDITVRGAVSIGRRLMDPLAELVKIDPKSIGVGQYQHDVDQVMLKESLDQTVISAVNSVGVDLNTASPHLLQYVSGLGPTLARKIVETRSTAGRFEKKEDIRKIPRLGEKAFEQCAGFLRIRNGINPLDNTGIHPESAPIVHKIAKDIGIPIDEIIGNHNLIKTIPLSKYVSQDIGLPTLEDIIKELSKPGHDPRGEAQSRSLDDSIQSISDVKPGMILYGIIGNMTNFGAFVDLGIKENGLIHISQITNKFIKNPSEVLTLGMQVKVKVMDVDVERKRINLTMKGV